MKNLSAFMGCIGEWYGNSRQRKNEKWMGGEEIQVLSTDSFLRSLSLEIGKVLKNLEIRMVRRSVLKLRNNI